ncbi:MAG: peptide ABC transporter substrate-binding protein [Oscillospiraceae bacterium]|nr:peptide ABC transporter substrate-binding protein [Oscillospiraceae bacterium]
MGLLTANADGSLSEGVASDYIVSDDGLVYTFKLRQDVYWVDSGEFEQQCTAKDFVYGFQRLFLPETSAPRASEYYCIKNSRAVNTGGSSDASILGVKALGDFELEITLEYPNPRLPALLSEPPAMPCCEDFFVGSQGKYGLSAECTPSNGAFYVYAWDYDPYTLTDNNNLILRRNSKNSEARTVYPSGLNFFIEEDGDFAADFLGGTTTCIAVTDEEAALIKGEYGCEEFKNITVGLIFNRGYELFKNEDFPRALGTLTDRRTINKALTHFAPAYAIVPEEVSMLDKSYRELAGSSLTPKYSAETARGYYDKALPSLNKDLFAGARIIVPNDSAAEAVGYLMQEWQREYGFYCVVEVPGEQEYLSRLKSGDYEIAALELTGSYNSPSAYLESFRRGSSANYGKYRSTEFEELMDAAEKAVDLAESAELYAKAEQLLIDDAAFVPLYYKNEYFYYDKDCSDIIYNPFTKNVYFRDAKKF